MENNHYIEILKEIGLSEHESAVYFTMVSLGPSPVLKIARTSDVKRTTIYSVIDSLKEKGLVRVELKGFKSLFVAESPEKLEGILEQRKNKFKKHLLDFMQIYNKGGGESLIKIYEGLEAVKGVYESLINDIKNGEDYLIVSDAEKWFALDRDYFMDFTERRSKLPIKIRMLIQDNEDAQYLKKYQKNFNYTTRILPKETKLTTNLIVTPQKAVVHQLVPPIMAIVIENKNIIKMHQEMFEVMWKSLEDKESVGD
ncbi:MAG: helix-turn-helix domain-containing protein [Candidatus Paceibacterota bacterium]|jgi:sugar-specific transcriptional regulator TrmB